LLLGVVVGLVVGVLQVARLVDLVLDVATAPVVVVATSHEMMTSAFAF
jgi:hypothetical protein